MTQQAQRPPVDERGHAIAAFRHRIRLSWLALVWERLWPALVPLCALLPAYAALSSFGQWGWFTGFGLYLQCALWIALALIALAPLRHLRLPTRNEAIARLDRSLVHAHRPIAGLNDRPLHEDALSSALWQAHQQRNLAAAHKAHVQRPRPDAARRDPFALRAALLLTAFVGFVIAGNDWTSRLRGAGWPTGEIAADARLDLWITPPAYTGQPAMIPGQEQLTGGEAFPPVPQGSMLSLRGSRLRLTGNGETIAPLPAATDTQPAFEHSLRADTALIITAPRRTMRLDIRVIPDLPPKIAFDGAPQTTPANALRFGYRASDDYGVTRIETIFEPIRTDPPAHRAAPHPLIAPRALIPPPDFALTLPKARPREAKAIATKDLTAHPWAGSRVYMSLRAGDDAGNTGMSDPVQLDLPARSFKNPIARILVEQRRRLALDVQAAGSVNEIITFLTRQPERGLSHAGIYLAVRLLEIRLANAANDEDLQGVVAGLWDVARLIEDGNLSQAEARLREAQDKLEKALKDGASDEELRRLMQELRAAMQDFLREAMQRPRDKPASNAQRRTVSPQDLEAMLKRMEELARSGNREAAQALLEQFANMMSALRDGAGEQQGQDGMKALDEMMRAQQQLMDRTFKERNQGRQQPGKDTSTLQQLENEQRNLRDQLDALRGGMTREATPQEIDRAYDAMNRAGQGLKNRDPAAAVMDQGRALDELRRGARKMQQQAIPGGGKGNNRGADDPLHNDLESGMGEGSDTPIPDRRDTQRSREILEELRRRLAQPERPKLEQDYLERLLRP